MHKSRLSIFVSSASQDLRSYREVAVEALLKGAVFPVVQEYFPPDYRELTHFLTDQIRECDAVICLVGFAFGSAPVQPTASTRRSYTQIEYDVASALGKRTFVFLAAEDCMLDHQLEQTDEEARLQLEHRAALGQRHKLTFFHSPEELRSVVAEMLLALDPRQPGTLPFKDIHPHRTPAFFAGRQDELRELNDAMTRHRPCVVVVVGMGGQGKTTLVSRWWKENELAAFAAGFSCTAYRGGFTFDMFLDAVLAYLTEGSFTKAGFEDPNARAQKLIELMQERPSLIVIDGIERWLQGWNQSYDDVHAAQTVSDKVGYFDGLDDFLSAATSLDNGSHLLLTTRALPAVLEDAEIATVPVSEPGKRYPLAGLSDDDAVALLRAMGVDGEQAELIDAARSYANHPLALTVLGSLLAKRFAGKLVPLGDDAVLDPKRRLFHLLEETRANLPGREEAERFLQVASHCLDNPSLELLDGVLARLRDRERGVLAGLIGNLFLFGKKEADPQLLDIAVVLADWQLLDWDGLRRVVKIHPVIKGFFVEHSTDSKEIQRCLAEWYSTQLIAPEPVSMEHAKPRLLAIEHAMRAGEVKWAADMMFAPFTVGHTFYDWLSTWGHLSAGTTLLQLLANKADGELRGELLLARASLYHQLGYPHKSLDELDEAIEIFSDAGSSRSKINLARAVASRGNANRETGASSRALPDFDKSLEIFRNTTQSVNGRTDFGKSLVNRGNALLDLGHWSRALDDYDHAVATYRSIAETDVITGEPLLAAALVSRGIVLAEMENAERSISDFNEAIALYEKHKDRGDQRIVVRLAHARTMLGTKLVDGGNNDEAMNCFNDAIGMLEPMVNEGRQDAAPSLALAFMDRAKAHLSRNDAEVAAADATRAIAMYERLVNEGGLQYEGSLGHSYLVRAEALHSQELFADSVRDRNTGFTIIRKLVDEWAEESDIRLVFFQRAMSAIEYLLPVSPREASEIIDSMLQEAKKVFGGPAISEALMNEGHRLSRALERLRTELMEAGLLDKVIELTRVVHSEDYLPYNNQR